MPLPPPGTALFEPSAPTPESPGPLVLLVDDEDAVREAVAEVLRSEGYSVVAYPDGRGALAFLERSSVEPALILLDLVMPVMDGWEFLRQRSLEPRLAAIPVALVSGHSQRHAGAAAFAGVIEKPLQLANLCHVVGRCTGNWSKAFAG